MKMPTPKMPRMNIGHVGHIGGDLKHMPLKMGHNNGFKHMKLNMNKPNKFSHIQLNMGNNSNLSHKIALNHPNCVRRAQSIPNDKINMNANSHSQVSTLLKKDIMENRMTREAMKNQMTGGDDRRRKKTLVQEFLDDVQQAGQGMQGAASSMKK